MPLLHAFPPLEVAHIDGLAIPTPHALATLAQSPPPPSGDTPLDALLPAPLARDLLATPLSLRAALLGMQHGRAFLHHERRVRPLFPPHLQPEAAVWQHGSHTQPRWVEGVLTEPKYFSFFIDAPLPIYNPNHRSKWRAHELLHGAITSFWSPTQTRFELYLGARLAELLPVIHWYGWDELDRPRCPQHHAPTLHTCPDCERLAREQPFWSRPRAHTFQEDLQIASHAQEHLLVEWRACMQELSSGQITPTPRPGLDASRDALGYLRGHWPRLTSWSFGAFIERFMLAGHDYFNDLEPFAAHTASTLHALLVAPLLRLDPADYARQRQRRAIQDLGYRALLLIETGREGTRKRAALGEALLPAIDALALSAQEAMGETLDQALLAERVAELSSCVWHIARRLPAPTTAHLMCAGHDWLPALPDEPGTSELAQLVEGITSAAPTLALALAGAERPLEEVARAFIASPQSWEPLPLAQRLALWLEAGGEDELAELAALDGWIAAAPREDELAQALGMEPESAQELYAERQAARLHATARRGVFSAGALEAVFEQPFDPDPEERIALGAAVSARSELGVVLLDEAVSRVFDALEAGIPEAIEARDAEAMLALHAEGLLVWEPRRLGRAGTRVVDADA